MSDTNAFAGLEPHGLWRHFEAITRIPRPSGQEGKMAEHVCAWAERHGFRQLRDRTGNLCIHVPGRGASESAPPIVLQSHLDMVCERDSDSSYDSALGRIHVLRDGDWLRAEGTTLGADNGIGCAAMMYLAELPDLQRGPLDLLFTIDEERGLEGAKGLDPGMLRGSMLLNLDSEDDGTLVVGCSGGCGTTLTWKCGREAAPAAWDSARISVSGLQGGHSGLEIDKPRLNAIRCMARILRQVAGCLPLRLAELNGGDKTNAIPRECRATVAYPADQSDRFDEAVRGAESVIRQQFRGRDDGLAVGVQATRSGSAPPPFSTDATARLLDLLGSISCGVLALSPDVPGLVETSNNLGVVRTSADAVEIRCSSRSSVPEALREVLDTIAAIGRLAGAAVQEGDGYPGWKPNMNSRVLDVTRRTYERLFGARPVVTAIHAGLECGLIGQRLPGMDMLSLGPDIKGVHAPGERVRISSVKRFAELLAAVIHDLSNAAHA